MPLSLVLSLDYLLGYLNAVVPLLSRDTIKVVTFLFDCFLTCSHRCLSSSSGVYLAAIDNYSDF